MSFCFCRLAVWRPKKIASIHPFDLTVRKILHPFTRSTLPFEKIASVHPFDFTVRKMLHPFSRSTDVSNGLSSHLLSVRLPCVRPFERIMPFVHSPKGKALVLAVHSRETRNFSRETRHVSRETRRVLRDSGNLHLSGTVGFRCCPFQKCLSSLGINTALISVVQLFSGAPVCQRHANRGPYLYRKEKETHELIFSWLS